MSWSPMVLGDMRVPVSRVLLVPAVARGHRECRQEAGSKEGLVCAIPGEGETQSKPAME